MLSSNLVRDTQYNNTASTALQRNQKKPVYQSHNRTSPNANLDTLLHAYFNKTLLEIDNTQEMNQIVYNKYKSTKIEIEIISKNILVMMKMEKNIKIQIRTIILKKK